MRKGLRSLLSAAAIAAATLTAAIAPCNAAPPPWQIYTFRDGAFSPSPSPTLPSSLPPPISPVPSPFVPESWHVAAAALADTTNDGHPEWVLLVWRPWQDWPIQRWSSAPSPIAGFHDGSGDSCHLILLDPETGREIWAGSALPAPLLTLAVGDVDGDGRNEVVTLEGDYAAGREGPAARIDVWRWNGFGFTLQWRSPPGMFRQLRLTDDDNGSTLNIAAR